MTALSESFYLMFIHNVFPWPILTHLLFSQIRKLILDNMISKGIYIPKAVEVNSDQGFGCDFGCNWERPLGPGQVWSEPIQVGVLGEDDGM